MELISKKGYQKLCDELKDIDNEIKETKRKRSRVISSIMTKL